MELSLEQHECAVCTARGPEWAMILTDKKEVYPEHENGGSVWLCLDCYESIFVTDRGALDDA